MKAVLLGSMLLWSAAAVYAASGGAIFEERCTPCHTIGGGDQAGPDLVGTKRFTRDQLRAAVKKMEINVGPLTAADVDALCVFLANAAPQRIAASKPEPPRGDPANGRRLFYGAKTFANGGTPCFACHAVGGDGGNLAADLASAKANVAAVATQPAFPMMKATYTRHAVTDAEALDVAAFVAEAKGGGRQRPAVVHGTAAGIAVLAFAAVGLIVKRRRNKP
ncbi:MAG TPA: c-type cytochrome [Thermoanaerobaculia bacterium]|nr:c-type cytochrome [Thermoanaerobaculia bacterium]